MTFALQHMGTPSWVALICWIIFLLAAIYSTFQKPKATPLFLFGAAVSIALAFALFSPYLYSWDEQFHALVGKNLSQNPLFPKLYPQQPLPPQSGGWVDLMVWMHKQPLFTWQMAASIKIFGTNAFAVRFPSVLFHGLLVLSIFRIGTLVFNRKTGFIAAILIMHSSFLLGLISGKIGTDHNDFIFLAYITFSCWAWFEWKTSANKKWIYRIGIFAGCAILTKWLVGLLVFAGWGLVIASQWKKEGFRNALKSFLIAFGITVLVAAPWQIYGFVRFPVETAHEMQYNSKHFSQALEMHSGDNWFYFQQIRNLFFNQLEFFLFLITGLIFLWIRPIRKEFKIFMLSVIAITYLFFTLAQTKMPGFTLPAFGFILLLIAFGISEFSKIFKNKWIRGALPTLLVVLVCNLLLKPGPTLNRYGLQKANIESEYREIRINMLHFMQEKGSDSKRVVFGVQFFDHSNISWMFFNDEIAYRNLPREAEIDQLIAQGYKIAVVAYNEPLPAFLKARKDIEILYFKN